MVIAIKQIGHDGFGHQLHGLFTCLILHGIHNYYFDGYMYINNNFTFEHINEDDSNDAKQYLINCITQFIKYYNLKPILYNNYIFSHEIYNIPINSDDNTLYGLDNVFFFNRIPTLSIKEQQKHMENISIMKQFFINDSLPPNRLANNNIVFHIRLGDAMYTGRGSVILEYIQQLDNLIDLLNINYPNYTYYIHSDGNVNFIIEKLQQLNITFTIYNKNTKLLNVLSDLIHSKIFICGVSSLSSVCSFLGNKELVITNDNIDHSMPTGNIYKISDYIKSRLV